MAEKTVLLVGSIVKETEKAMLFNVMGTDHWFPLSTIWKIKRSPNVNCDEIEVDRWIAKKKELAE